MGHEAALAVQKEAVKSTTKEMQELMDEKKAADDKAKDLGDKLKQKDLEIENLISQELANMEEGNNEKIKVLQADLKKIKTDLEEEKAELQKKANEAERQAAEAAQKCTKGHEKLEGQVQEMQKQV